MANGISQSYIKSDDILWEEPPAQPNTLIIKKKLYQDALVEETSFVLRKKMQSVSSQVSFTYNKKWIIPGIFFTAIAALLFAIYAKDFDNGLIFLGVSPLSLGALFFLIGIQRKEEFFTKDTIVINHKLNVEPIAEGLELTEESSDKEDLESEAEEIAEAFDDALFSPEILG